MEQIFINMAVFFLLIAYVTYINVYFTKYIISQSRINTMKCIKSLYVSGYIIWHCFVLFNLNENLKAIELSAKNIMNENKLK